MSDEPNMDMPDDNEAAVADETLNEALMRAMSETNEGNLTDAVATCKTAISRFPTSAEPYFILAVIAFQAGDEANAIEMAETAHRIEPDIREYAQILGTIYTRVGRLADGVYFSKLAEINEPHAILSTVVPPGLRDFHTAAGAVKQSKHGVEAARLFNVADFEAALKEAMKEVQINAGDVLGYTVAAKAALALGQYEQALSAAQAAVRLEGDDPALRTILARALLRLGRYDEAVSVARIARRMAPLDGEVFGTAIFIEMSCPHADAVALKRDADEFEAAFADEHNDIAADDEKAAPDDVPAHVGFVSNAFFLCQTAEMLLPWFNRRANNNPRFSGYRVSIAEDTVTTAITEGMDHRRPVYDVDPFTLALTLQAEKLDALVDVSTPEFDARFSAMALRPCRVRVGVTALPEPGLAPGVTHILTDETMAAGDSAMLRDGQELITVPGSLFAREPYASLPQEPENAVGAEGLVTFGALASLPEVSIECVEAWAAILRAVPGARLMMIDDGKLGRDRRVRLREYFMHAGIIDHVLFGAVDPAAMTEGAMRDRFKTVASPEHWRSIDIFLDSFPLNSGVVVREALWSGVPALTLAGDRRAGRLGASMVAAAKRPGWIAETVQEYIDLAGGLAQDIETLSGERAKLLDGISETPLFDAAGNAKAVREALVEAAKRGRG